MYIYGETVADRMHINQTINVHWFIQNGVTAKVHFKPRIRYKKYRSLIISGGSIRKYITVSGGSNATQHLPHDKNLRSTDLWK